jgi:hypothetical protein
MHIPNHSYRCFHLLHVRFIYQHLSHVLAEVLDGVLTEQLTFSQLLNALVQVKSHSTIKGGGIGEYPRKSCTTREGTKGLKNWAKGVPKKTFQHGRAPA